MHDVSYPPINVTPNQEPLEVRDEHMDLMWGSQDIDPNALPTQPVRILDAHATAYPETVTYVPRMNVNSDAIHDQAPLLFSRYNFQQPVVVMDRIPDTQTTASAVPNFNVGMQPTVQLDRFDLPSTSQPVSNIQSPQQSTIASNPTSYTYDASRVPTEFSEAFPNSDLSGNANTTAQTIETDTTEEVPLEASPVFRRSNRARQETVFFNI